MKRIFKLLICLAFLGFNSSHMSAQIPEFEMILKGEEWPQVTDKPELAKKYAIKHIKENIVLNPASCQDIASECFYDNKFFKAYVVVYKFSATNGFGATVCATLQANVQIFKDLQGKLRYQIYNIIEVK